VVSKSKTVKHRKIKEATFYDCFFYFNSTGELTPHKYYSIKTEKAKR
jgi:hypothetical protein